MANVKGRFITLTGMLMAAYPAKLAEANVFLKENLGKTHDELDPEEWLDAKYLNHLLVKYAEASAIKEKAIITMGRNVYPTIKKAGGLPPHLKTPLDFILFEAEGFLANHQGDDVIPRRFISQRDGEVIVHAPAPGYSSKLYEGVFLGILKMCGVETGNVQVIDIDTFKITW